YSKSTSLHAVLAKYHRVRPDGFFDLAPGFLLNADVVGPSTAGQFRRLTESQVLDRRTRQVLHDDILPELHEAMLTLSSVSANENVNGAASETVTKLAGVHHQIADLLRDMPRTTVPAVTKLGLVGALHHLIEEELPGAFDDVDWQIAPQVNEHLPRIPALVTEVIYYASREAIRNAAHYARDTAAGLPLYLRISVTWLDGLSIEIEDNGAGIDATAQPSIGSGQGLALHTTMMAVVGGTLSIDSVPGEYTLVSLLLPQNAIGV
ncbi:MAG: ATP-binding protein, partial [Chloroflexota bacterium]